MCSLYSALFIFVVTVPLCLSGGMPGGFTPLNVNDAKIQALAERSAVKINAESNGPNVLVPVKVVSAKSQVVAGTKTVLEILLQESSCSKAKASAGLKNCAPKNDGQKQIYTVSIWEKPWEHFEQITIEGSRNA